MGHPSSCRGQNTPLGLSGRAATRSRSSSVASVGTVGFSLRLADNVGQEGKVFLDIGFCSPSKLDPTGQSWHPGPDIAHWMGEQGPGVDWIYRSSGGFKASTSSGNPSEAKTWCLEDDDTFNRGTVRPWEPATVSDKCGHSGGWQVFFDTELGALRTAVDTTGMCFGVCE